MTHDRTEAAAAAASSSASAYPYKPPVRAIFSDADLRAFHQSKARALGVGGCVGGGGSVRVYVCVYNMGVYVCMG